MLGNFKKKLLALALRGAGISGKFLLVFLLTRKISLEFQGIFSLMNTNVALLVILIGLDFHVYSNKLIVKDRSELPFIFKNSLFFFASAYVLLIPISFLLNSFEFVQSDLLGLFIILVVLEHLGQELFRIYISIEQVIFANVLFFLRSGLWSWILAGYLLFSAEAQITIEEILTIWTFSALSAVIMAVAFLPGIKDFFKVKIDKQWIVKGFRVGLSLFIATVSLKIIEYSDRYLIDYYLGKKELGIYAFFFQLANLVNVLIFTLYISFVYPKIYRSVYENNLESLRKNKREIYRSTTWIVVLSIIGALVGLPHLLPLAGKAELYDYTGVLYLLIISILFLNFSFSSHFVLIAREEERKIVYTTLFSCIINISINLLLIPIIGIIGAAIAALVSSVTLWLTKVWAEKETQKEWTQ